MNVVRVLLKALAELHGLEMQVTSRLDRHRLRPDETDVQVLDRLSAIARDAEAAVKELDLLPSAVPGAPPPPTLLARVQALKGRMGTPLVVQRDVTIEMAETLLVVRRLLPLLPHLRDSEARKLFDEVRGRLDGKLIKGYLPES
jgi:hypothetical protein